MNDKLVVEREANNGTRGQRHCFFVSKPCRFNAIGDVTGTPRAKQSRTEEQASVGHDKQRVPQSHLGYKRRIPKIHPGCKHQTLPEVWGLLE